MPAKPIRVKAAEHGLDHFVYGLRHMKALCGVADLFWERSSATDTMCPLCREEWDYVRRSSPPGT